MSNKLYVGNLPYGMTDEELSKLFSEVGTVVSATIINDRETQKSKGFGFVEMETPELAQEAISKFDGYEIEGRAIVVNEARPQKPREFQPRGDF